jgi:hypothetical protein
MVWTDRFITLFFLTTFSVHAYQIVPFIPKDKSSNLLYQTADDQVRYLLQNQNTLSLVEVAKSTQIHKSQSEIAHMEVIATKTKKHILVQEDNQPFSYFNPKKNKKIYWSTFKGTTLNLLGEGSMPKLHLDDQWASFFDAEKKAIQFESLELLGKQSYKINLNNKFSSYFIPEVSFIDYDQVLYTDINEKGEEALITYNLKNKAFSFIHKVVGPGKKISFCLQEKEIIIAEYDLGSTPQLSLFSITYRGERNFSDKKTYLTDNNKYLPRILCSPKDKSVFLLKYSAPIEKQRFGSQSILVNISIPKVNTMEIPFDRFFSQMYLMDDRILLQSSGRIYQVVK